MDDSRYLKEVVDESLLDCVSKKQRAECSKKRRKGRKRGTI